ncbi:MAG: ATP-binding protein [Bacteroidota bacterium]
MLKKADSRSTLNKQHLRAFSSFLWLSLLCASSLIAIILSMEIGQPDIWPLFIIPALFVFYAGLVIVYTTHTPEPVSFAAKLVVLALATVLTIIGLTGGFLFRPFELITESQTLPDANSAISFQPRADGGYDIVRASIPMLLVSNDVNEIASPLPVNLEPAFTFYGKSWGSVTVSPKGALVFGSASPPVSDYAPYNDFFGGSPTISPFYGLTGLSNRSRGMNLSSVQVTRIATAHVFTWRYYLRREDTDAATWIQTMLHDDGKIDFIYGEVDNLIDPKADYGAVDNIAGTIRGIHPGFGSPQEVHFDKVTNLSVAAVTGAYEDMGRSFFAYVHVKSSRLFALLVISSLIIILLFPLFFRQGLLNQLNLMLAGMQRVSRGERDVIVPVMSQDEMGRVAAYFNDTITTLRNAEDELKSYAHRLESGIAERTADLEKSRAQLEEQTRQLQEMDQHKTRFFANLSHEFRTPLSLIIGPLEDLQEGRVSQTELTESVPGMHRNASRLLTLINQLLDLSRLDHDETQLDRKPTDLSAQLNDLVVSFSDRARAEDITLLFDAPDHRVIALVDPDQIEKMISNLLSNAFKFTPPRGKIRLALRATKESVSLKVEDTGRGIPPEALPHIFDRFYRAKSAIDGHDEGTGIGLALTKELVELHDGTIEAHSKQGFGTTLTIVLPRGIEAADVENDVPFVTTLHNENIGLPAIANEERPIAETQTDARLSSVLVIEDNPDMRAYIRGHLKHVYHVFEATDGKEGLSLAREHHPDLILCDVMMPVMDGFTFCRLLREDSVINHIPVVLLTARASDQSRLEGLNQGADDYLTKPFNASELLTRAENLIQVRQMLRRHFTDHIHIGPSKIEARAADAIWLDEVREAIESLMGDSTLTIDRLADEVGMSKRQLQRKLKGVIGFSPHGYLRMMRLKRSAQLLEAKAGSVSEIAYKVGYNNPDYFARHFKQGFGVSPSSWPNAADNTKEVH